MDHASVRYKVWVRARLKELGWDVPRLVEEMKRKTPGFSMTTENVYMFLGRKDEVPVPSNIDWMTELNRALRLPPPPRCDPGSEISQLQDRIADKWWKLTQRERGIVLGMFADEDSQDDPGNSGAT